MRRAIAFAAALFATIGCGGDSGRLSIVLDVPELGSAGYPFGDTGADTLRLTVAREGDDTDLLSVKDDLEDGLSLDGIPFGTDLVLHLFGERDGVEIAYGRSCAIDYTEASGPESVHIYFSRLLRWGPGPIPVVSDRIDGHMIARENDSVVIAGGSESVTLELFNPRTGELEAVAEAARTLARRGSTVERLAGDQAVIIGGVDASDQAVTTIELLPDLRDSLAWPMGFRNHESESLVSGIALVAGGELWDGSTFTFSDSAWEIETSEGGAVSEPLQVGNLAVARARHSLTRLSDEVGAAVVVVGGLDAGGQGVATTEVYRPLSQTFEPVIGTLARWDHEATRLPGGSVLILGGFQPGMVVGVDEPARELVLFDPIGGGFKVAGELPQTAPVVDFVLTVLPDGRLLMSGGRDVDGALTSAVFVVRFDVINGLVDVAATEPLTSARAGHAAALLCDGTVLINGGEAEIASAPSERYNPTPVNRR